MDTGARHPVPCMVDDSELRADILSPCGSSYDLIEICAKGLPMCLAMGSEGIP